jgi:ribonuclease HI
MANIELTKIAEWARNNKIQFNEHKSKTILISRRKRTERKEVMIYLNSRPLTQVQTLKYLGIVIDRKLTFKDHIDYITTKCSRLIFALSKSAKVSWRMGHEALKTIYRGAVLPLLQYGAPVWGKALEKDSYKRKLIRVQRLINIRIAKAYCTVSNEALCIINGITPIDIKLEETAQLYLTTRRDKTKYDQPKSTTNLTMNIDYDTHPKDWLHPADTVQITEHQEETAIQIYTDGSKSSLGVGAGIAIFIHKELIHQRMFRLHSNCSNSQAEQLAIVKAIEIIQELQIAENVPRIITIYTDSKITLQSLTNPKNHKHLIDEIRKQAVLLSKNNWQITFTWIRAHVGHFGNELADKLAKEAAGKSRISYNKIPIREMGQQQRERSLKKWQMLWDTTSKAATRKEFFPNIKTRLSTKITQTPNFTAMVTLHGNIREYLHRFKIIESPDCPCGGGNQTVDNIIYECYILQDERERLIGKIARQDNWPVNKSKLGNEYIKQFKKFTNSIDFTKL